MTVTEPPASDKNIERYLKLLRLAQRGEGGEADNAKRLADKMRRENPGLHDEVKRRAARAKAEAVYREASGGRSPPPEPADGAPWIDRFTHKAVEGMLNWAASHLEDVGDTINLGFGPKKAPKPQPKREKKMNPQQLDAALSAALDKGDAELACGVYTFEGSDEEIVEVHLSLPVSLWDEIVRTARNAHAFAQVLDGLLDDADDDDADDDSDEE